MRRTLLCAASTVVAVTLASTAGAVDLSRPDENAIFGAPEVVEKSPAPANDTLESVDNKLQLGGRYYQRFIISDQRGVPLGDGPVSAPLQFDGFLDARPNDSLRGFINARLLHDPARDQYSRATRGNAFGSLQTTTSSTAPASVAGTSTVPNNPTVALDQAWLKFDIDRTVFVTAGKQHVKWGTGRFWNPTDFLHTARRDPLLPYDLRLGNSMVKFELPWEAKKTNFYAAMLFDNPQPASTLRQLGSALRLEKVLGDGEIGVEAIFRGTSTPVYGADFSTGLGPFDVYLEAACLTSSSAPHYSVNPTGLATGADLSSLVTATELKGPFAQVTLGANYQFGWRENRQATAGFEYFYNQLGYSDAHVYPALVFFGQFQPFYTGRNYAAFFVTAEGPDAERKTQYTFSTLANVSDRSFLSRLDFSWRVLTYLTFEAYGDVHFGTQGGEFNFKLSTPALTYQGNAISAFNVPSTLADAGLGLRISF